MNERKASKRKILMKQVFSLSITTTLSNLCYFARAKIVATRERQLEMQLIPNRPSLIDLSLSCHKLFVLILHFHHHYHYYHLLLRLFDVNLEFLLLYELWEKDELGACCGRLRVRFMSWLNYDKCFKGIFYVCGKLKNNFFRLKEICGKIFITFLFLNFN